MNARPVAFVALLALVVSMSGCLAPPAPEETTPAFPSEEEAFAAAEETYRAYVDALNQVDLSDPETFEPVFALTTGTANSDLRESLSQMHADGWRVAGPSTVALIDRAGSSESGVVLSVCLDVSEVVVTDQSGTSVVDSDRVNVQSMSIEIAPAPTADSSVLIAAIRGREGSPTCDT